MAGIIDSFFVQVGLDASQFTIGQREADKAWTKTKDQTVAAAKKIEENTRRLAEYDKPNVPESSGEYIRTLARSPVFAG